MSKSPSPPELHSLRIDPSLRDEDKERKPFLWILLVFVLIAGFGIWWWVQRESVTTVNVVAVRVLEQGNAEAAVLSASGYVEARRQATVSSRITGQVVELLVEEGMQVDHNQILAKLDDTEPRAELARAKVQVAVAEASITELEVRLAESELTYSRTKRLFEQGAVSEEQLDQARMRRDSLKAHKTVARRQFELAESSVAVLERHLENYVIRAPFAGVAISKDAQIGEIISPVSAGGGFTRTGISTIVDMNSLEIEVDVNESFIARVSPGQRVIAVLDAHPGWEIPATVRTIIPAADRQRATVKVRIAIDQLDPRILPEMGVKVSFLSGATQEKDAVETRSVLIVPSQSISREEGRSGVWVKQPDDTVVFRTVVTGAAFPRGVEIKEGLRAGEWVVADASTPLRTGQRIEARR